MRVQPNPKTSVVIARTKSLVRFMLYRVGGVPLHCERRKPSDLRSGASRHPSISRPIRSEPLARARSKAFCLKRWTRDIMRGCPGGGPPKLPPGHEHETQTWKVSRKRSQRYRFHNTGPRSQDSKDTMKPECFVSCLRHSALVVNLLAVPRFQEIHHQVTEARRERISPFFVTSCLCGESPGLRCERLRFHRFQPTVRRFSCDCTDNCIWMRSNRIHRNPGTPCSGRCRATSLYRRLWIPGPCGAPLPEYAPGG
jgi:hypothetical protein